MNKNAVSICLSLISFLDNSALLNGHLMPIDLSLSKVILPAKILCNTLILLDLN